MKDILRAMLMVVVAVTVLFGSLILVHPEQRVFLTISWLAFIGLAGYTMRIVYKRL